MTPDQILIAAYVLLAASFAIAFIETQDLGRMRNWAKPITILFFAATWPLWVVVELFSLLLRA